MAYDAVSNRTVLADSTGRYTTLYDSLNRPRAVTNPAQMTISYGFDAAGRRAWMIEPSGGRFTYGYSPTDLNTLVINPQGERTTWQFDANSRVAVQRLANLIRVSYAYDDADRLVRLANLTSTGATITSYRDAWDPANNRLARVEQDGTLVTWSYDATYQLTRERRNGANSYDTTYACDPAGNRRFKLDNAIRTTYSYDVANQLQKYVDNTGTTTFGFDATGNQRFQQSPSSGTTTNTWDYENRLTKVALPSGVLNTFAYNGDGQRVQRKDSSGTSKQIWDDQKIVEETDQTNAVQVVYTQSTGEYGDVVSQRRSGVGRYFLFDPLFSTIRLTDGSQNATDSYLFKAFGESLLGAGPTTNPFRFVGGQGYYSDADLSWNSLREREYAASVARFLSVDPLRFDGNAVSWYLYASNNPLSLQDPSGMTSVQAAVLGKSTFIGLGAGQNVVYRLLQGNFDANCRGVGYYFRAIDKYRAFWRPTLVWETGPVLTDRNRRCPTNPRCNVWCYAYSTKMLFGTGGRIPTPLGAAISYLFRKRVSIKILLIVCADGVERQRVTWDDINWVKLGIRLNDYFTTSVGSVPPSSLPDGYVSRDTEVFGDGGT